jgi:hypothetical protein
MSKVKKKKRAVDPVEVQLSVRARVPKGTRVTRTLLDEVVDRWAHGRPVRGFEVQVVRWRNSARQRPQDRAWRHAKTASEKNCALIRRALRHGMRFTISLA